MSKIHLDRLKKEYGAQLSKGDYQSVMSQIIANSHENVQRAVARVKVDELNRTAERINRSSTKQIAVPNIEEVLPKRSVYARKGIEQGRIISDTLRDRLTKDLRDTVSQYLQTGKNSMQYKKGERRGQINPELVKQFRARIEQTYSAYTKPDKTGIPPNVSAIAETEVRSAVDDIKQTFNQRLQERNPGRVQIIKRWRHHPSFSAQPRDNHHAVNGEERPLDAPFNVPLMTWVKGRGLVQTGFTMMMHPHDPAAPAGQVISCHCECDYITRIL